MDEFKPISDGIFIKANKAASRMVEKMNANGVLRVKIKALYYICLEVFSFLWDDNDMDGNDIYMQINDMLSSLNETYFITLPQQILDDYLWKNIYTSNQDGDVCSCEDFLKNLAERHGCDNFLFEMMERDVISKFPNYKKKLENANYETYKFELSYNTPNTPIQSYSVSFQGAFGKDEITKMLETMIASMGNNVECGYEGFGDYVRNYLDTHGLDYKYFLCRDEDRNFVIEEGFLEKIKKEMWQDHVRSLRLANTTHYYAIEHIYKKREACKKLKALFELDKVDYCQTGKIFFEKNLVGKQEDDENFMEAHLIDINEGDSKLAYNECSFGKDELEWTFQNGLYLLSKLHETENLAMFFSLEKELLKDIS